MRDFVRAASFAAQAHTAQRRNDAARSPYINHPLAVAAILVDAGYEEERLLVAAVLHDTLEDTAVTCAQLIATFGHDVADLVQEVTDDKRLPKALRKQQQLDGVSTLSPDAQRIRVADKIANVTDLIDRSPNWSPYVKMRYGVWCRAVVERCQDASPSLYARFLMVFQRWLDSVITVH